MPNILKWFCSVKFPGSNEHGGNKFREDFYKVVKLKLEDFLRAKNSNSLKTLQNLERYQLLLTG